LANSNGFAQGDEMTGSARDSGSFLKPNSGIFHPAEGFTEAIAVGN